MKFAYITAALLGLAYANPIVKAPEESSLEQLDARDAEDVTLFNERDEDDELFGAFDDFFAEIEAREAELDLEDDVEDEVTDEIAARGASSVLHDLHKIVNEVHAVNNKLNKFGAKSGPSPPQALAVQKQAAHLTNAVKKATNAAKKSKKFSKKDTKKIFHFIQGSVKKTTLSSLSDFRKHAPGFKSKGFGSVVKKDLGQLKGKVGTLGHALLNKAGSKKIKHKGSKILNQISQAFKKTINAY